MLSTLKFWSCCNRLGYHGDLTLNLLPKGELVIINTHLVLVPTVSVGEDQSPLGPTSPGEAVPPPPSRVLGFPRRQGKGEDTPTLPTPSAAPAAMLLELNDIGELPFTDGDTGSTE